MWWGFTPALDLLDEIPTCPSSGDTECTKKGDGDINQTKTMNVLLIGQYDNRHVLKTIAQKYRHPENIALKLYVYEPLLENIGRELLFITMALEPEKTLGLADKTKFFMELYGNTLIRPATSNYLMKVSSRLLHMITNFNYAEEILPSVSFDMLKFKERDQLEIIFKYWSSKENDFEILASWDERMRNSLGKRYDLRLGVFDWDYHMRYRPYGADLLGATEYKKFREKGMAFYNDDSNPCIPNKSLASAIISTGSKITSYGYLGDIVTGPFVTFGFNCEDQEMLKSANGLMRKTSTDVTERNVLRMFYETQHQAAFTPTVADDDPEKLYCVMEDGSSNLRIQRQDSRLLLDTPASSSRFKNFAETYTSIPLHNTEIIFLPVSALKDYSTRSQFEDFFDLVFIPQSMVMKYLTPELAKWFKLNGRVIVDTPKYVLSYRKEDLEKFKAELEELLMNCKCTPTSSYDVKKDEFVRFQVSK